jgi:hypothetical protein
VSAHALSTLYERWWNKPLILPLTEDITRLHKYLNAESERCQSAGINVCFIPSCPSDTFAHNLFQSSSEWRSCKAAARRLYKNCRQRKM